jgi:uncharacterized Zn-binding protein involved in type VI secretion
MPSVAVNPPKTPVTKGSSSIAAATLPNVCKMPGPPAPFVPTPLPNIGQSGKDPKDYSTSVKIEGQAVAIRGSSFGSSGDIASKGTGGGLISMNTEGPTKFIGPGSMDVQIEGKNVQYLGDPMMNNCGPSGSPANAATMTGVVHLTLPVIEGLLCQIFCECKAEAQAKKYETPMADMTAIEEPGFDGSDPPGRSHYQACVERKFNKDYKGKINVTAEQTFNMKTKPPSPLPASARGTPGTRRPDFVVTNAAGKVTDVIEMKFPGDSWRPGQKRDYTKIAGGKPPTEMNEQSCKC